MAVTIGNGDLSLGGAIMTTSMNDKIAVFIDSGSIEVWKQADSSPTIVDTDLASTVFGGGAFGYVHAAIDGNDDIHVITSCTSEQTRDVAYVICDLDTGFGAWEEALDYTDATPSVPGCSISLDSNDKPHILVVDRVTDTGSTQDNVYYTEKTGASWATPTKIGERTTNTDAYNRPKITLRNSDYIEALYYFDTDDNPAYRSYTGSWGSESVYSEATGVNYPYSVTSTTGGTVYRYHKSCGGATDEVAENNVSTGYPPSSALVDKGVSAALDGTDRYFFYIQYPTGRDVNLISNTGSGWTDEGDLQTGTCDYVIAEWAYNNENQNGEISYIFEEGTSIYYDSFALTTDIKIDIGADQPTYQGTGVMKPTP
jgi:hypothetical protein